MSNNQANGIANLYEAAIAATVAAAEKVPGDKRMAQIQEGRSHPTWLLGHMAAIMNGAVGGMCLAQAPTTPPEYHAMFAPDFLGGEPIKSEASAYPAWDDILEVYKKTGSSCVAAIRELADADLDGPAKGNVPEAHKDRFAVLGDSLNAFAIHNAHHTGQLAQLAALEVDAATAGS